MSLAVIGRGQETVRDRSECLDQPSLVPRLKVKAVRALLLALALFLAREVQAWIL